MKNSSKNIKDQKLNDGKIPQPKYTMRMRRRSLLEGDGEGENFYELCAYTHV